MLRVAECRWGCESARADMVSQGTGVRGAVGVMTREGASPTGQGQPACGPLFLVGAERSGTTLLRLMLDHHPLIAWTNEFEYAVDHIPAEGGWPELSEYHRRLQGSRVFRANGFRVDPTLSYPQLVSSFLEQDRQRKSKRIVGASVHRHFDRLLRVWPEARFIHLVRDGRDVAKSCIAMGWAGNVWMGVERWIEAEALWARVAGALASGRCIEVRYESLIQDPRGTLEAICGFVGVPYSPQMLEYADQSSYRPPDQSLIAQWRRKLSARELQLVESRIAKMLVERGYELSGQPPLRVTALMRCRLRVQDYLYRKWFRLRRYGLPLLVCFFLARKLGRRSWQERLQRRIDQINEQHLK